MTISRNPEAKRRVFWSFSKGTLQNGGDHRSAQICELLAKGGDKVEVIERSKPARRSITLIWYTVLRLLMFLQLPSRFPRGWGVFAADFQTFRQQLAPQGPIECLIFEATTEHKTCEILKRNTKRLIIVPQNLESLGAQRTTEITTNLERLKNEIAGYATADDIFTISEDERWMLQLFGIDAKCLPYYPPQDVRTRLERIRSTREALTSVEGFLVLGTMGNPPTREGILELIEWLCGYGDKCKLPKISIAGNLTDSLKSQKNLRPEIQILGRLTNDDLDGIRSSCRGIIVHQRVTTGSITRIPESLLAGIPVLANENAARGYSQVPGVYQYRDREELISLLNQNFPRPPIPPRPVYEENIFLESVFSN